jgi:hypothetical protein
MNPNHKIILTCLLAYVFSLLFVTAHSDKPLVPSKQILSHPVEIRRTGHNKLSITASWYGFGLTDDGIIL